MKKPYMYALLAIGGVWLVIMLAMYPQFVAGNRETKSVLRTFDQYSNSLVNQHFEEAYGNCSSDFRTALPYDGFVKVQQSLLTEFGALRSVNRSTYEVHGSGTPMRWRAVIDADLKYEKRSLRFEFVFYKEGDRWVLFGAQQR